MKCFPDKYRDPRSDPGTYVEKLVMATPGVRFSKLDFRRIISLVCQWLILGECMSFFPLEKKNLTTLMLKHPGVVKGAYSPGPEDAETDGSGTSPTQDQASEILSPDALP